MSISVLLLSALLLALAMTGAWGLRLATGKSGWIDAIWSAAVGVVGIVAALGAEGGGRRFLVAGLVALWSGRLALHIAQRTRGAADDPRYAELARQWGPAFRSRLFFFLQVQAAAGLVLVMAIHLAAATPAPFPGLLDGVAALLLLGSILGEATADAQLACFRATAPAGSVCDVGLWGWSRHPNYFFEWLGWCAFPVFALAAIDTRPLGLLTLAAPALMWLLLVRVSGIPPLEAQMLASRGEAFRAYAARVSPFVPLPPRAGGRASSQEKSP